MNFIGPGLFVVTALLVLVAGRRQRAFRASPATISISASSEEDISLWVRIAVTGAVLGAALYIILTQRFPVDNQKWAFGVVGTILGYWLKG